MILVNNPGDGEHVHAPLRHADWHGLTPADLIFPFFLFIVGCSIAHAADRLPPTPTTLARIARRALVLVAIGLLLNLVPRFDVAHWRLPGVLQRIGLCYALAAIVTGWFPRALRPITVLLLLGYFALLRWVPDPSGSGGWLAEPSALPSRIDRAVLGPQHLLNRTLGSDPEGLLSTLPAVATTMFGVLAGRWARAATPRRLLLLAGGGAAGVAVAHALDPLFPINKKLWTSTFALGTAGWGCIALALLSWLVDVRRLRGPLVHAGHAAGRNALAIFVASGLLARVLGGVRLAPGHATLEDAIVRHALSPWLSPANASLAYALGHAALWLLVALWLDRRRWYIRV